MAPLLYKEESRVYIMPTRINVCVPPWARNSRLSGGCKAGRAY